MSTKPTIGFIGQGFVGKNIANDFEGRGYTTIRHALEEPYNKNEARVKDADIVFIAVPTPSTPEGFDDSILRKVIGLVGRGKTAVIKSTILPGTTESIQEEHSDKTILFSPEFLNEATAAHDSAFPIMNMVGIPEDSATYRDQAQHVLNAMPESAHEQICHSRSAEIFKYVHNIHGVWRILFANFVHDLVEAHEVAEWDEVAEAMSVDPYMTQQASYYNRPVHKSGRGAGGHCFIKDLAAFREGYKKYVPDDKLGAAVLEAMEQKNIDLLRSSKKDLDLLEGVYGSEVLKKNKR